MFKAWSKALEIHLLHNKAAAAQKMLLEDSNNAR
jgi:hypothetical protein